VGLRRDPRRPRPRGLALLRGRVAPGRRAAISHYKPITGRETVEELILLREAATGDLLRARTELSTRQAERSVKQQECWALGGSGKREWFRYEGEYATLRAATIGYIATVERRVIVVNRALRELEAARTRELRFVDTLGKVRVDPRQDRTFVYLANIERGDVVRHETVPCELAFDAAGNLLGVCVPGVRALRGDKMTDKEEARHG
jgi:hypothetical protein